MTKLLIRIRKYVHTCNCTLKKERKNGNFLVLNWELGYGKKKRNDEEEKVIYVMWRKLRRKCDKNWYRTEKECMDII